MQYVRLGHSGLKVSRLCLGCLGFGSPDWMPWILDEESSRPVIAAALENGINFFDTADMYSLGVGEAVLGRAISDFARREDVVIASKVFFPHYLDPNEGGLSRKHIFKAIDRSLKNLGTDYIDLYQIHRFDYDVPIEETLEALHDVVRAGKVRYIGASSMSAWQFAKLLATSEKHGWARFVSMQPQYNLIYREEEREMLPLCEAEGVGVIPWSPLAGGFLTGRYTREASPDSLRARDNAALGRDGYSSADYDVAEALIAVAEQHGVTPAQAALAWMLTKDASRRPSWARPPLNGCATPLGRCPWRSTRTRSPPLRRPIAPSAHRATAGSMSTWPCRATATPFLNSVTQDAPHDATFPDLRQGDCA